MNRRGVGTIALVALLIAGTSCKAGGNTAAAKASTLYRLATNVDEARGASGSFAAGKTGDQLAPGDRVRTDLTGHAELDWPDGSLTRLGQATTVRISPLAQPDKNRVKVQLDVGATWHRVERVTGSGGYEVQTPVGVATVRGTQFAIGCTAAATCTFQVVEGTVAVTPTGGATILLTAGQALTLPRGATTATPTSPGVAALQADPFIAQNETLDAKPAAQRSATLAGSTTTTSASAPAGVIHDVTLSSTGANPAVVTVASGADRVRVTNSTPDFLHFDFGSATNLALSPGATFTSDFLARAFEGGGRQRVTFTPANNSKPSIVVEIDMAVFPRTG